MARWTRVFYSVVFFVLVPVWGAVSAQDTEFQRALEALNAGRYIQAENMFQKLVQDNRDVNPDVVYFAAKAAWHIAHYKRAEGLVNRYLASEDASLLYQKDARSLKATIAQAIAAYSASDQSAFAYAQKQGTIFAYAAYRRQYPDGENVTAADFLSFRRAKEINGEIAYIRYLEYWPEGSFRQDAQRGADNAAYRIARQMNTERSYQQYFSDYPNGINALQAKQRAESLAFYRAKKEGTVEGVKAFLALYPGGGYASEAMKMLKAAEVTAPQRALTGPIVTIPKGVFIHRKPAKADSTYSPRLVEIKKPFTAMAHEVTFAQWDKCGADGGCGAYVPDDMTWGRLQRPVINVSRLDIEKFILWFNAAWHKTGAQGAWRLPSEIEWAYMAHASYSHVAVQRYAVEKNTQSCAACDTALDSPLTFPVGSFKANSFDLYDMLGNAGEWVADCWHENFVDTLTPAAFNGALEGCVSGVVRGRPNEDTPAFMALQVREKYNLNDRVQAVGFRLVLDSEK